MPCVSGCPGSDRGHASAVPRPRGRSDTAGLTDLVKKSNASQDRLTAEVCRTTSVLQRFPATDPSGAPSKADFEHPPTVRAAPKRLVDAQSRWLGRSRICWKSRWTDSASLAPAKRRRGNSCWRTAGRSPAECSTYGCGSWERPEDTTARLVLEQIDRTHLDRYSLAVSWAAKDQRTRTCSRSRCSQATTTTARGTPATRCSFVSRVADAAQQKSLRR